MDWLLSLGYLGLFLGTLLAGTVLPLSSDILMIGMLAAGANVWACLVIATVGNALGGWISYCMGWLARWEWLEKWFKVKEETLRKQKEKIDKYGVWVALGSWFPVVGTLSVIALGFYRVRPKMTALLLLIGCFIRFAAWVVLYLIWGQGFVEFIAG